MLPACWLKTPVFTLVVIFTLAVGIGANTAMFSIVNGVLLQGLPFKHADRIVDINEVERRDIARRRRDRARQFPRLAGAGRRRSTR